MNIRESNSTKVNYIGVTGGKLSLSKKTDSSTPHAEKHIYKDASGNEKSTWKVFLWNIVGKITKIELVDGKNKDGKTFEQLAIHVSGEDNYVLQMDPSSKYAHDFLAKARSIDYSKECFINSYYWEEKNKKGFVIKQDFSGGLNKNDFNDWDIKVGNFYWDVEAKAWSSELPKPEGDTVTYGKDDWKLFFLQLTKFYKSLVATSIKEKIDKDNFIENSAPPEAMYDEEAPSQDEAPSDDLPF